MRAADWVSLVRIGLQGQALSRRALCLGAISQLYFI